MWKQLTRSLRIFILTARLLLDVRKIQRAEKRQRRNPSPENEATVDKLYARAGARVRRGALSLQGLIVKVGQFLSARADILPRAFTHELTQLQDAVPAADFRLIKRQIESELGSPVGEVFTQFSEQSLAAASLGQVHIATLRDGPEVAVKVLRPGMERLAATDLAALRRVVGLLSRFTRFGKRVDLYALYGEFAAMTRQELDYRQEAENLRKFRRNFADSKHIVTPVVYDTWSTRRVLVMSYVDGVKLTNNARLDELQLRRDTLVEILLDAYLQQILKDGFIHVDPHPGNLLALADGRVAFLDFGMTSEIPRSEAQTFAKLVLAAISRDIDTIIECIDILGFLQPHADRAFLKRAVAFMLDRLTGTTLARGPELDDFIDDFQDFLHDEPLVLPARYMFLGRSIGLIAGLLTDLKPDIRWADLLTERALPMVNKLLDESSGDKSGRAFRDGAFRLIGRLFGEPAAAAARVIVGQVQDAATTSLRLPGELERVVRKMDQGDLTIRLQLDEVMERLDKQRRLFVRAIWAMFTMGAAVIGTWMQIHHFRAEADAALLATIFGLVGLLFSAVTARRTRVARVNRPRRRARSGNGPRA